MTPGIICKRCDQPAPRTGPRQFYCRKCSDELHTERQNKWAREHPQPLAKRRVWDAARVSRTTQNGIDLSRRVEMTMADTMESVELLWLVRFTYPFSYAASKNHIYALRPGGHIAMREESSSFRKRLTAYVAAMMAGRRLVQHKVWIDLLVQKPNHRGDAINILDLVADAIKDALQVDDRWFCLRRLDWQIVKTDPQIYIGIGQEANEDHQACSSCGRILPFASFGKKTDAKRGIDRNCRECRTGSPSTQTQSLGR